MLKSISKSEAQPAEGPRFQLEAHWKLQATKGGENCHPRVMKAIAWLA